MYNQDSDLLDRNILTTNIINAGEKNEGPPTADYIPHKEPTDNIVSILEAVILPQQDPHTSTIKVNTDVALKNPIDISTLPIPDTIKEVEERNIVVDSVLEAEEKQKIDNKDISHSSSARAYFLEKITQFSGLYDDKGQDPVAGRRLAAIAAYFRDPTSSSSKWTNMEDIVVYGGLDTGVKFSAYLEYFVLPPQKRPKITPTYFDQLMQQVSPFLNASEVQKTTTDGPEKPFGKTTRSSVLDEPEYGTESDEGSLEFITTLSNTYRHSAQNARTLAVFAYLHQKKNSMFYKRI